AADGQAKADAVARLAVVGAEEFLENASFSPFWQSRPAIGNRKSDVSVDSGAGDFDRRRWRRMFDRVVEQIHQNLFEGDAVDADQREIVGQIDGDRPIAQALAD